MIYLQALENVLAALRPETRKSMIKELEDALQDTSQEQESTSCEHSKTRLLLEVGSLKLVLNSSKKVQGEYDEIHRRNSK